MLKEILESINEKRLSVEDLDKIIVDNLKNAYDEIKNEKTNRIKVIKKYGDVIRKYNRHNLDYFESVDFEDISGFFDKKYNFKILEDIFDDLMEYVTTGEL